MFDTDQAKKCDKYSINHHQCQGYRDGDDHGHGQNNVVKCNKFGDEKAHKKNKKHKKHKTCERKSHFVYYGITGSPGPSGPSGPSGPDGAPGQGGATGPRGLIGPDGPQGATGPSGATGASGPMGVSGATGIGVDTSVITIRTIMRTPSQALSFGSIVGPITFTTPSIGTLTGTIGATNTSIVKYVPNIRIPRWPELQANDSFSFTGFNALGNKILTIVNVTITAVSPNDRYITIDSAGDLAGIRVFNDPLPNPAIMTPLKTDFGANLATNNVDGIVFARTINNPPIPPNTLIFWDPVTGITGPIGLDGIFDSRFPMNQAFGASYDNDRAQLLLAYTNKETRSVIARLSFLPYVTNDPAPVLKSIENIFLFSNAALTTTLDDEITDIAWDPSTKRTYVGIVDQGRLFFTTPYDMRSLSGVFGGGTTGSRALQCFSQTTSIGPAGATASPEMTFTNDGTVFYEHNRYSNSIYTVNQAPTTAIITLKSQNAPFPAEIVDIATWPVSLALTP